MKKFILFPLLILIFAACAPDPTAPNLLVNRPTLDAEWGLVVNENILSGMHNIAGDWPSRPLTMVVPFHAGGETDSSARIILPFLQAAIGQQINIVNVAGFGGAIGSRYVADAAPDGYTFLFSHDGSLLSEFIMETAAVTVDDFIFSNIIMQCDASVFMVHRNLEIDTAEDFFNFTEQNPGVLRKAVTPTTFPHADNTIIEIAGGAEVTAIDVGETAFIIASVRRGSADVASISLAQYIQHANDGTFIPLWVTSHERNPLMPNIPTRLELGIPESCQNRHFFNAFPAGTSNQIVRLFSNAVYEVSTNPAFLSETRLTATTPYFVPYPDAGTVLGAQ